VVGPEGLVSLTMKEIDEDCFVEQNAWFRDSVGFFGAILSSPV
jgi:hypothetical protein